MPEKAKNYYDRAVVARVKDHPIDKAFSLYSERLYTLIFQGRLDAPERDVLYSAFVNVLQDWAGNNKPFDLEVFKNEVEGRLKLGQYKIHDIYFGIPLRKQAAHRFAFTGKILFKDVTFKR